MSDGRVLNLSNGSRGTFYLSSNPAIATVSQDGFVEAVSSGVAIITATHEGVIASIALTVALDGDSDGDGIPDDFETANAIDPGGSNLAGRPGVSVTASSFSVGFPPERVIDGDLQTSWFTAEDDAANRGASPFIEVTLPAAAGVAQVRLFGNRQFADGRDFFAGIVRAFDAGGIEIFNSGELRLTNLDRDLGVALDRDGVQSVRFTSTSDQGSTPGLSEFQLISRPGGTGFDPNNPADAMADFDGDGLSNLDEFNLGTSPFLADTDGDGLTDAQEIGIGSSPVLPDSDNDGLLDGDETSPAADSDGDGLINILDPDSDNDGLSDALEFLIAGNNTGADPNTDSDGDGLLNIDEADLETDPTKPDTDGDGLDDLEEALGPTDPLDPDSDGDGFRDGLEVELGSDPLDPDSIPDPTASLDTLAGATFSILNLVDPGDPSGTDPITEALSPTLSILNLIDPGDLAGTDPITEALSPTLSVLNLVDPGDPSGTDPITEALSPTLAVLNLVDPGGPSGSDPITEALSPTLSVLNLVDPGDPSGSDPITEALSPMVSILNQVSPSGVLTEAGSPLFSIFEGSMSATTDLDGDGMSDLYEILHGLDPTDPADAAQDPDRDGLTNRQEFERRTDPQRHDTDGDGLSDGEEAALGQDPTVPDTTPPQVAITTPAPGSTVFAGQTLEVSAAAFDDGRVAAVDFSLDGVVFETVEESPFEMTWTVPSGLDSAILSVRARDTAGNASPSFEAPVSIEPDPLTTVRGRALDAFAQPMAEGEVEIYLQGLTAELFDFDQPLSGLRDLADRAPVATVPVSAINFRNPGGVLASTMPGEELAPDYAVRFSGLLELPRAGRYRFTLGATGSARLVIAGQPVGEIAAAETFVEATGTIALADATVPITVVYFQDTGHAELQLSYQPPDGKRRVIPTSALLQTQPFLTANTDADGHFSVAGVPTVFGSITVGVTTGRRAGKPLTGWTLPVEPERGGITDCGLVEIEAETPFSVDAGGRSPQPRVAASASRRASVRTAIETVESAATTVSHPAERRSP